MSYADLRPLGVQLKETMKHRIATANRISHLAGRMEVADLLRDIVDQYLAQEELLSKLLDKELENVAHPKLLKWQQDSVGIGIHLLARLIGEVGDPAIADPQWWEGTGPGRKLMHGEPFHRTPQQFFRYCGYGDPNDKRRKGMTAEEAEDLGRPLAKSILRLMAEGCLKSTRTIDSHPIHEDGIVPSMHKVRIPKDGEPFCTTKEYTSPYRWVYDRYRVVYATREGWTPKHQHNAALRKVARAIMLDIWLTSQGMAPTYGHGNNPGGWSGQSAAPKEISESKMPSAPIG